MRINKLFEYDSPFVIESLQEVRAQLHDLRSSSGLGQEGATVHAVEWNYFIKLQKIFSQKKFEPFKFHSLNADLPDRVAVNHQIIKLKDRTCLWDGGRLYLLSQVYIGRGASSLFRRAVMIPLTGDESLTLYAVLAPAQRQFNTPNEVEMYIDYISQDYDTSYHAYSYFYPYLAPKIVHYQSYKASKNDIAYEKQLPALLTRSYGEWDTLLDIFRTKTDLDEVSFLSVIGWFLSVIIFHNHSCLHRDLSDNNALVIGPGVFVQLIDLCSVAYCENDLIARELVPFSSHPDFSAQFGCYERQTDEFSLAFNLLRYEAFDGKSWSERELNDLVEKTNYEYTNDSTLSLKIKRYTTIYDQMLEAPAKASWILFLPHLLRLVHPNRSSRGSLFDIFSDEKILNKIQHCINTIATDSKFSEDFIAINGWSLVNVIAELHRHHDQTCTATTSLMMLLVFALHYERVPIKARINHKRHIDLLLHTLTISPQIYPIIFHYEAEFPGLISKRLSTSFIDGLIIDVFNEFLYELDQVSAVVVDLCCQVNDRIILSSCNDSLNSVIDRIVLREECESTLNDIMIKVDVKDRESKQVVGEVLDHLLNQAWSQVASNFIDRNLFSLQKNLLTLVIVYSMFHRLFERVNYQSVLLNNLLNLSLIITSGVLIKDFLISKYAIENSMTDSQRKVGLFRTVDRQPYDIVKGLLAPKI